MRRNADILFGMIMGFLLGFLAAICIIDDKNSFRIPGTDRVFIREVPTEDVAK